MAADPALVAAIAADPYAPAPRLAYADRLRARGEADRAQFVDVGLRLAALVAGADEPRGDTPAAVDAAWHARDLELDRLAARRDALLIAHGERWALAEVVRPLGLRVGGPAAWLTYDGITDRRRVTVPDPRAEAYVGTDLGYAATTTFRDRLILAGDVVWPLRPFAPTTEAAGWVGWRSGGSGYRTIRLLLTDQDLRSGHIGQLDYCWTTVDHARAAVHRAAARYCRSLTGLPPWPP